jgi:hypothetical protein
VALLGPVLKKAIKPDVWDKRTLRRLQVQETASSRAAIIR